MLMMEHRTPQGLEIRMFGKEAKRILGFKVNRNDRDETEEELQARFARVLRETNFAAIAEVFAVEKMERPTPTEKKAKRVTVAPAQPQLALKETDAIPSFLAVPKK